MKVPMLRTLAVLSALVIAALIAGAASKPSANLSPDKLVILSTTDVKGKTSPCG